MDLFELNLNNGRPVTAYGATGVFAAGVLELPGDIAVNVLRFSPAARLPEHAAGRPQLFVVVQGGGWVSGADRANRRIHAGQAAFWNMGEPHESGTDVGMLCVVVQSPDLDLPAGLRTLEHPAVLEVVSNP